jgi:hypothetical protein
MSMTEVEDDDLDPTIGMDEDDGEGEQGQTTDADEGQDEGDPVEDDEGEAEDEGLLEPRQQPQRDTRSNNSVRESRRRAQEAEQRASRFEQELADLKRQFAQAQQPRPTQQDLERLRQEEDERLALMTPAEIGRYYRDQMARDMQVQFQQQQMRTAEDTDRRNFASIAQTNPLARRYADDVEKLVTERRNAGENVPREVALAFLIGREAIAKATGRKPSGSSQRRVEGTRTRPTNATGQGQGARRGERGDDSLESLERRLKGVTF